MVGERRLVGERPRHRTARDGGEALVPAAGVGERAIGRPVGELPLPVAPEPFPPPPAAEVGDLAAEGGNDDALELVVAEREGGEAAHLELPKTHAAMVTVANVA